MLTALRWTLVPKAGEGGEGGTNFRRTERRAVYGNVNIYVAVRLTLALAGSNRLLSIIIYSSSKTAIDLAHCALKRHIVYMIS